MATPEFNILLLGETGSGKSTTLCAIANFLLFNTFEEARNNLPQLKEPVPLNFTLPYAIDDGEFIVKSGDDANERSGDGQSATVAPASYLFPFENCVLRLIDTPGMGDTAGKETDINNFNLIMDTLAPYDRLHGVVFVVDGKFRRRTAFFKYYIKNIKNLVEQLHSSIKQNIIFCFTNSEISPGRFGPGSNYFTLDGLLKNDIPEVGLHLKREDDDRNCFFVENQCYRQLVAEKRGYKPNGIQNATSILSWEYSTKEIHAMIRRILALPPQELKPTISVNTANRIIRQMFLPTVVLLQNLTDKIKQVEEYQKVIEKLASKTESLKDNAEELMKQFKNMNMYDVEIQARQKPVLVCTAQKCVDFVVHDGTKKWIFKTKCCEPCNNPLLGSGIVGESGIEGCDVMKGDATCSNCGCPASDHRRDAYDYHKVRRPMAKADEYDELVSKVNRACSVKEQKKVLLDQMRQTIEEMKVEMSAVERINAQFDCIAYHINKQPPFFFWSIMHHFSTKLKDSCDSKFIERLDELSATMTKRLLNLGYEFTLSDLKFIEVVHMRRLTELGWLDRFSWTKRPIVVNDIRKLQKQLQALKHSGQFFRVLM